MAIFTSNLSDDIIFNQTNATQGYFANVGSTRRNGIELGLSGQYRQWTYAFNGSYIDATFQSPFNPANNNNSSCISLGGCSNVVVQPGSKIPNIPAFLLKFNTTYQISETTQLGTQIYAQGPTYARGDETNTDINGQVPGYMLMKVSASHRLSPQVTIFGSINNLLNRNYSSFGNLAMNNITTGIAEQFRSYSGGRTIVLGIQGNL
jgi:outer membrane receptor protein involved in Fe transport